MSDFAERTGLTSANEPRRYLWTDAFALCNFLELYRRRGDGRYHDLCERLIAQVHMVLGRHRPDDPRSGWLSELPEAEGAAHPTAGGLRIGKPLPERRSGERFDADLEWERDGQYFHYLTKWMDALSRAALLLDQPRYQVQAEELATAVFPRFLERSSSGAATGLAWKMSIDLSRAQTPGSSPHDALDGYVTFKWLDAASAAGAVLDQEIGELLALAKDRDWLTDDPLGLGGLLLDAFRLTVIDEGTAADRQLVRDVLSGVVGGLQSFVRGSTIHRPAFQRLAFRELGLAIGMQTVPLSAAAADRSPALREANEQPLEMLRLHADLGRHIVAFWSEPKHRDNPTWQDHRDINDVMLATALLEAQPGTAIMPAKSRADV